MAEADARYDRDALLVKAAGLLERARVDLSSVVRTTDDVDAWCEVVDDAARWLALLGADEACPREVSNALLDWRDRLSSHILAARALAEIEVHADVEAHMLERGLSDVAAEVAARRSASATVRLGS